MMTRRRIQGLDALVAAIRCSPIMLVRRSAQSLLALPWASVRQSPDVDAYILAWIASHSASRPPRSVM